MKPEEIGIAAGALLASLLDTLIERGNLTRGEALQVIAGAQTRVPGTRSLASGNAANILAAMEAHITTGRK